LGKKTFGSELHGLLFGKKHSCRMKEQFKDLAPGKQIWEGQSRKREELVANIAKPN
jgi:hypothetical protein